MEGSRVSAFLPQLEQIHEAFSPEDLLLTRLEVMTKEGLTKKAVAGRVRERLLKYTPEQDKKRDGILR